MTGQELSLGVRGLALLRSLRGDTVLAALLPCLENTQPESAATAAEAAESLGAFGAALYGAGGDLGNHLLRLVLESENPLVHCIAAGQPVPSSMQQTLQAELAVFSALSQLQPATLQPQTDAKLPLPVWENTPHDFAAVYSERLGEIGHRGYGIFASYHMFTLAEDGALRPVQNPDPQRLAGLTGYRREREQLLLNTRALLRGLAANNVLLYGDAGTGKSSTVKALGNEFAPEGLRIIEVRKNQLYRIPGLMDRLADNPLKFILFIDDLSFPDDDGDFTDLKAILEGNVSARPRNIVVYATSNRRHMLRQSFSARAGDEVHLGDTLQEQASLSARFGLTITFLKPDRELYLDIVRSLAREQGLRLSGTALADAAEAHALRYGGRSPRVARQFVELQVAAEDAQEQ